MAVSTDNPVVGAFQLMWDNWVNVLNFLSKGSVTVDSVVVVTLVMIVVGVLVYVMLKNIVFAKLGEAIKGGGGFGGEALSNWVPFLITISIVLLMVYTGVILLLIPWLWVLFIAMIIGIGWMLWGGTKAFITTGMDLGKQFSIGEKWAERRELGRERQFAAMEKEEEFTKRELAAEERLEETEGRIENALKYDFTQELEAFEHLLTLFSNPMYANQLLGPTGTETRQRVVIALTRWQNKIKEEMGLETALETDVNNMIKDNVQVNKMLKALQKGAVPQGRMLTPEAQKLKADIIAKLKTANVTEANFSKRIADMEKKLTGLKSSSRQKWYLYETMLTLLQQKGRVVGRFIQGDLNRIKGLLTQIIAEVKLQVEAITLLQTETVALGTLTKEMYALVSAVEKDTLYMAKIPVAIANAAKPVFMDLARASRDIAKWSATTVPADPVIIDAIKTLFAAKKLASAHAELKPVLGPITALHRAIINYKKIKKPERLRGIVLLAQRAEAALNRIVAQM